MTGTVVARGSVRRGAFTLGVDLNLRPGEVVGVLGPNGAGKTTLLRALAGLDTMSEGRILAGERTWVDVAARVFLPSERRSVGYVFQNYRLFPHLSVRDNVGFAARAQGASKRESREAAAEWLTRLGIAELAPRAPRELSGGQAQRVALARALAVHPTLLLLDEPLAALDAQTRIEVRSELRTHLAEFAGATVVVTHDPLEAMMLADRLVVLEGGRIVQQGAPADVARRPATQYTARLVGLNLYEGTVTADGISLDGGGVLVAAEPEPIGSRALVAMRPSAVALHSERPEHSSPRNVWPATVASLELLTDRVRVQLTGTPDALADVTPDAVATLGITEGSAVWLSVKATELDVYPAERRP
ncbi:MAG TPA: ABC transporter ATP-binding protein [Jatrophihabitantaceae bacterium]|nr:ABC transporter ATP-binding protein [Jatrophihabitantaceae bacterium]